MEQARIHITTQQRQIIGKRMTDDFGFSLVSEEQIEPLNDLKEVAKKLEQKINEYKVKIDATESRNIFLEDKVKELRSLIQPLLNNLKAESSEKTYIIWPNRVEVVSNFENKLDTFVEETLKK